MSIGTNYIRKNDAYDFSYAPPSLNLILETISE